jgi:hypothetical protein
MMLPFYDTAFESSVEDPTPVTCACSWMILFCTTFFNPRILENYRGLWSGIDGMLQLFFIE